MLRQSTDMHIGNVLFDMLLGIYLLFFLAFMNISFSVSNSKEFLSNGISFGREFEVHRISYSTSNLSSPWNPVSQWIIIAFGVGTGVLRVSSSVSSNAVFFQNSERFTFIGTICIVNK